MAIPNDENFVVKAKRALINTSARMYLRLKHDRDVEELMIKHFSWKLNGSFKHATKTAEYLAEILKETGINANLDKEALEEIYKYELHFDWDWIVSFISKIAEKENSDGKKIIKGVIKIVNRQEPRVKPYALLVVSRFAPEEKAEEYLSYLDQKFDSAAHIHARLVLMEYFGPDREIMEGIRELEKITGESGRNVTEKREALNYAVIDIGILEVYEHLPKNATKKFVELLLDHKGYLKNCKDVRSYARLLKGLEGVHIKRMLQPGKAQKSYNIKELIERGEEIYQEAGLLL